MPGEIKGQFLHFSLTQSLFDAEVRDSCAHERRIATRVPLSWQEHWSRSSHKKVMFERNQSPTLPRNERKKPVSSVAGSSVQ